MKEEKKIHLIQPYKLPVKIEIKRVCAYVRVSRPTDTENGSYENQVQYYTNLLSNRTDCKFCGVFGDNGISGGRENREGFLSMLSECQNGSIDEIYTKSISRFARNTVLFLESIEKLRRLNVDVFFEKEHIHSLSHEFDMLLSMYSGVAEEERKQVATNIKWSMRHQYENGNPLINASIVYGYKQDRNGNWLIDDEKAADVRFIFTSYSEGKLPREIAASLNEKYQVSSWIARRIISIPLFPNSNQSEQIKKVAAYCRVSTGSEEQLHSFKNQFDYYTKLLSESKNCILAGIYADEGITGTQTKKRVMFMQMIEDCKAGKIDAIITKSVSRFGRNTIDTLYYTRLLKKLNIDVLFEKENIHSITEKGELMLTMLSALSETESRNLSDIVSWGLHKKYEIGAVESLSLGKFLGYDKIDGKAVINESEATTVRRIYQMYLDGYSLSQMTQKLTEDHVPTERGIQEWNIMLRA